MINVFSLKNQLMESFKTKAAAVLAAISAVMIPSMSFALAWPPTAADITTLFTDMGESIGEIIMAIVAVAAILYGGVIAVKAAFDFFSKFYRTIKTAA